MTENKLTLRARGDREIVMTRAFGSPPRLVFEAWTRPELLRRWLLGPDGWTMPVCEVDLRVGGGYRFVWQNELRRPRWACAGSIARSRRRGGWSTSEIFDEAWYPGEAEITMTLVPQGGGTLLTETVRYELSEARDKVLDSPMEGGVATSYDRLEALLAEAPARAEG